MCAFLSGLFFRVGIACFGRGPREARQNDAFALFCERESPFLSQEREKGEFSSRISSGAPRKGLGRYTTPAQRQELFF